MNARLNPLPPRALSERRKHSENNRAEASPTRHPLRVGTKKPVGRPALLAAACLVLAASQSVGCGRTNPGGVVPAPSAAVPSAGVPNANIATTTGVTSAVANADDPATEGRLAPKIAAELWARAAGGDTDDLARLAQTVGAGELVRAALGKPTSSGSDVATNGGTSRVTAARALGYAEGLDVLPVLAELAAGGTDAEAAAALESLSVLAARPRRSTDPEDALEVRDGCDRLLALARAVDKSRGRRVGAVRVLRMMADRGCAKASDVPTDLDAK